MYHFLVNKAASSGSSIKTWNKIENELKRRNIEYTLHAPDSAEHALQTVKDLTDFSSNSDREDCHLVVLGGDGTLNLVIQGVVDFERTILSVIPSGSGNDFARDLGITTKNEVATLDAILDCKQEINMDWGSAEWVTKDGGTDSRRFLISTGLGYDADICVEANDSGIKKALNKVGLGKLIYLAIGVKQILFRKCVPATLVLDGKEEIPVDGMFFTVAMLHSYEGGGIRFCPDAICTDGLFDICLVRDMSRPMRTKAVVLAVQAKHTTLEACSIYRCKTIQIKSKGLQWIHTDGDVPGQTEDITITCHTGLRFAK